MKVSFLLLFLFIPIVNASGIGVSPTEIILDEENNEKYLHIINPNNYKVNYSVVGDLPSWINLDRNGEIEANSKKIVLIKADIRKSEKNSVSILFSDQNILKTGVNVEIVTKKDRTLINYLPYLLVLITISIIVILFR